MKTFPRTALALLLIIGLGLLVYLPAFEASFHLDDGPSIRDNAALRRLDPEPIFHLLQPRPHLPIRRA